MVITGYLDQTTDLPKTSDDKRRLPFLKFWVSKVLHKTIWNENTPVKNGTEVTTIKLLPYFADLKL